MVWWCPSIQVSIRPTLRLSVRVSVRRSVFHTFFYMLWHIELKFYIWLCFSVPQVKFEFRQFVSIFVGVMPLLELRILEIHSFPHFSLTCFNILSWNFAYDFVLIYHRASSSVINFRQFLWKLCPFWNLEYWKFTVFPHFSLACFDKLSWIFFVNFWGTNYYYLLTDPHSSSFQRLFLLFNEII